MKKRCQIPGGSVLEGLQDYFRMLCDYTDAYLLAVDMAENVDLNGQTDANTGLLGKYQFEQDLKAALVKKDDISPTGALMIFGLDNFKIINESYNRHFGNIMLQIAAKIIARVMPKEARLYRLDGDEFATIVPGLDAEGAQRFYDGVQKAFCRPHLIEGRHLFYTISAGTVLYPQGGKEYFTLYKHGAAALEQAKREGKNKNVFFTREKYNCWLRSLGMRHFLQDSIDAAFSGFSLLYQPQVDDFTQKLVGAEALLRWRSPRGRMVAPMEFVRILEETRMIIPVGRWVLETAVRQCREWQRKWPGLQISVNVSYEQVRESGFEEMVLACLKKHNLSPNLLVLELTESSIVSDWDNLNGLFSRLRSRGIRVAIDDFGTGYSSLGCLKNLRCDIVKIDRIFVQGITDKENTFNRQLVKSTIELCHSAGMTCCIEGVEHEAEYVMLRDFCEADVIQGYYFGRSETPRWFERKFFTPKFSGESKGDECPDYSQLDNEKMRGESEDTVTEAVIYNHKTPKYDAEDRRKAVEALTAGLAAGENVEELLWECIIVFQKYLFYTVSGLPFTYTLKLGRNGNYTKELFIDRREHSKSLSWGLIRTALARVMENPGKVYERPKEIADVRGISYSYSLLWRFGVIHVPEAVAQKLQGR